ncbi:sulfite exporter TauE/SafE family protein [Hydrotalea sandarakina]|uniref:Probable membrane transporter protein n=1 Tax=Hydrotalea sandarakina TaxID=1004304 RepID=A0A2W7S7F6_9BACT|nr:sulfite exporter TauE/SafE family protein [Hydrotalea sandarakina]PZX62889.1 hypothetical protein LX80_01583 [Hydrotalea sandarakina]
MENLYLFILLALLAEIAGTVGGFGSSLFFVPIASYFLDFHSVLGITALFHVSSNLSKIAFFRKGVNVMLIIYLGIPAVLFVLAGAWLTQFIATKTLEIVLSIFLIVISLVFLYFNNIFIQPSKLNAITGGTLSGFIAGLVGTGGAIRALVFSAFQLKTEVFIATSAVVDLAIDASRSFVYWHNGFVHAHDLYLIPILLLVSIAGTFIGKKILQYISESLFKKIVLFLILLTGVFTLFKLLY